MAIDEVEEADQESFPASDPPAYTGAHAGPAPAPTKAPASSLAHMLDWTAYRKELGAGFAEIGRTNPDVLRGYRTIVGAKVGEGKLDPKTRELIAMAVAVTLRCDGCIAAHVDAARKHGASKEEMLEALGVAAMINTGAALVYSARALDAFHEGEEHAATK